MTYLLLAHKKGEADINDIISDPEIPNFIKLNWINYCKKSITSKMICLPEDGNKMIAKTRQGIEEYLLSKYCRDEITLDDFTFLYKNFIYEHGLEDNLNLIITGSEKRYHENQLATNIYSLWKYGKKLRYYNIPAGDYTELLETLDPNQYHNIEISTLKWFNDYPELMKKYDIRDEYELHNLLSKIEYGKDVSYVKFNKMPIILFGEFDRDEMVKRTMFELVPISREELAETIETQYGIRKETLIGGWFKCINDYYHDGIYSVDSEAMPDHQLEILSEKLIDDFYFISEIKDIYMETFPDDDVNLVSVYNLKRLGFIINSTYAIRNFSSATQYFTYLLTKNEMINISEFSCRFTEVQAFNTTLCKLRDEYEIIEFEPYQYINISKLRKNNIDIPDLRQYCEDVYNFADEDTYFTIESLNKQGFISDIDDLGFEPWFYSSLLREDKRFSYTKLGGTVLFYKGKADVSQQVFIEYIIDEYEKMETDDLIGYVSETFNILLNKDSMKQSIKNTDLYYNDVMDTIYRNYNVYVEELESIDD